jgi:hypothetical protein
MVDILSGSAPGMAPESVDDDRELRRVVAPPKFSKVLRNALIVFGGLVILATVLVVVRETKYSPEAAVNGYLSALEERDTTAAFGRLDQPGQLTGLALTRATVVQHTGYSPPTNHRISTVRTDGNTATVTVSMTIGDAATTRTFHLVRDSASLSKVFRPWRIRDGLGVLSVTWPYGNDVIVADQRLPVQQDENVEVAAFPGTYVVSNDSAVLDSAPITVAVNDANPAGSKFDVSLNPTALTDVQTQIDSWVSGCAAQTTLQLSNCPFYSSAPSSGTVSNVVWTITAAPVYAVGIQPNYVGVATSEKGTGKLTYTVTDSSGRSRDVSPQTFTFPVDGYVLSEQGKAVYHVSRDN